MRCPGVLRWAKEQCTHAMPAKSVRSLHLSVFVAHDFEEREGTEGISEVPLRSGYPFMHAGGGV